MGILVCLPSTCWGLSTPVPPGTRCLWDRRGLVRDGGKEKVERPVAVGEVAPSRVGSEDPERSRASPFRRPESSLGGLWSETTYDETRERPGRRAFTRSTGGRVVRVRTHERSGPSRRGKTHILWKGSSVGPLGRRISGRTRGHSLHRRRRVCSLQKRTSNPWTRTRVGERGTPGSSLRSPRR